MKPQVTISEKLFKRTLAAPAILAGVLMAFITFVFDIYKDCNENGVTLFSINMALIHSVVMGGGFFTVFFLFSRKNWRKVMENDNTEKTKIQKICTIILGVFTLLTLIGGILYLNKFPFANIVFWVGSAFCLIILVVLLTSNKRKIR